jgi:hypothetical protein
MSELDWRSPRAYDLDHEADTNVAWECLRRSPAYQRAFAAVSDTHVSVPSKFRNDWGLVFRG